MTYMILAVIAAIAGALIAVGVIAFLLVRWFARSGPKGR